MSLLNPIWLWGLGALAIPVGIHLLSRKEGKTIRIGSIRFLAETSTSKFSSIRLNEVALLAVRILLITLIVLLLAGLLLHVTGKKTSRKWVLVEKSLENDPQIKTALDSLEKNEFEIRRLSEDFPVLDSDSTLITPDYYKLTESLSQQPDLQAVVFATNSLSQFKGKRISLPDNITWLQDPASTEQNTLANDLSSLNSDTLYVTLAYEQDFQADKNIIKATLNTLQPLAPKKIVVTETIIQNFQASQQADWIIWLSNEKSVPGSKSIYFRESMLDELIIHETRNTWALTKRLTAEIAVEQHLPVRLMEILFAEELKTKMLRQDKRTASNELAWSTQTTIQSSFVTTGDQSTTKILAVLISLLFIAERILAFYRKQ